MVKFGGPVTLPEALQTVVEAAFAGASAPRVPEVADMGVPALLSLLRGHYGTVTAASRAAGIDRRTWQRIESGASRGAPGTLGKLRGAAGPARQARVERERAAAADARRVATAKLTDKAGKLRLTGTVAVSNDVRPHRSISLAGHMTTQTRADVISAVRSGRPAAGARIFEERGLWRDYGAPGMTVIDVDSMEWGSA